MARLLTQRKNVKSKSDSLNVDKYFISTAHYFYCSSLENFE